MANNYMTVETTNLEGCICYSLQSTTDVQNGAVVGKGELVTGERSVFMALDDYTDGMFLVANTAWDYDTSHQINQNEENFINKAGIPFRVYELKKYRKFTVGNLPSTVILAEGDFVEFKNGVYAKAAGETNLKVERVIEVGYPYFIGSAGTQITGDSTNEYGYALDTRTTKYIIRVV